MKQEDKKLLLTDLCGRLPYGIKAQIKHYDVACELLAISTNGTTYATTYGDMECLIETFVEDCKPYLFPMSSMTDEQREEYWDYYDADLNRSKENLRKWLDDKVNTIDGAPQYCHIDWLNAHYFDYRNLIPKGLAIDCTNLNIY